jgi:hypothetical protein
VGQRLRRLSIVSEEVREVIGGIGPAVGLVAAGFFTLGTKFVLQQYGGNSVEIGTPSHVFPGAKK